ncbi:tripartite tricarboxylate transporter substrate binding protein (plasmid) [Diaphorobacter sp. HDW4B]|uniref:tripartite tricarboxylate transporter substrate binding protein n=1 Tax=Diaphorobacter sp. HDW4B TaxID=2714925 RepID=UPI00140C2FCD|nr:tripartite tricarboxylate transporter substrate binding protein [Diaphorobacter sp. HDW4B]QIL74267.1 tripartite tricarboxylate transporter substrate binding protein [Diaphorobacter sp. HDW4B]
MNRRTLVLALAACMPLTHALAQNAYPQKPVKLIVPYAPGGSADIAARLVSEEWGKALGQSLVIENKGGAGGNLGVDAVAKSPADGYTIGLQTVSLAINPWLTAKMPYDTLKDLAPIGMVATSQHVLVVNNALPAKNLKELMALLSAKQGEFSYGSAGSGSTFHIAAELFKSVGNFNIMHVPYRGGGPALVDTIGGQVQMSFPVLSAAAPQVQGGKLRAIGVTGKQRSPLMPDVPTIAEGGMPNYAFETWFMVFAPAGTPAPVIEKLNATLRSVLAKPNVAARMAKEGFDPLPSTPAEARARLERELPQWGKLVKERGITAD